MARSWSALIASSAVELRALLGLRDTARALLDTESASADDIAEIAALRAELNRRYDTYLRSYGPLNRFTARHQPSQRLMQALVRSRGACS